MRVALKFDAESRGKLSCLLWDGLLEVLEELVEAGGHELHADPDVGGGDEAAEADDDVAAVDRLEHHVQVHQDPLRLVAVPRPSHLQGSRLNILYSSSDCWDLKKERQNISYNSCVNSTLTAR